MKILDRIQARKEGVAAGTRVLPDSSLDTHERWAGDLRSVPKHRGISEVEPYRDLARCILVIFQKCPMSAQF